MNIVEIISESSDREPDEEERKNPYVISQERNLARHQSGYGKTQNSMNPDAAPATPAPKSNLTVNARAGAFTFTITNNAWTDPTGIRVTNPAHIASLNKMATKKAPAAAPTAPVPTVPTAPPAPVPTAPTPPDEEEAAKQEILKLRAANREAAAKQEILKLRADVKAQQKIPGTQLTPMQRHAQGLPPAKTKPMKVGGVTMDPNNPDHAKMIKKILSAQKPRVSYKDHFTQMEAATYHRLNFILESVIATR